jgi:hypothetical protein
MAQYTVNLMRKLWSSLPVFVKAYLISSGLLVVGLLYLRVSYLTTGSVLSLTTSPTPVASSSTSDQQLQCQATGCYWTGTYCYCSGSTQTTGGTPTPSPFQTTEVPSPTPLRTAIEPTPSPVTYLTNPNSTPTPTPYKTTTLSSPTPFKATSSPIATKSPETLCKLTSGCTWTGLTCSCNTTVKTETTSGTSPKPSSSPIQLSRKAICEQRKSCSWNGLECKCLDGIFPITQPQSAEASSDDEKPNIFADKHIEDNRSCMERLLSKDRVAEIRSGISKPTWSEQQILTSCFLPTRVEVTINRDYVIPDEVSTCLKSTLTESRYNEISSGKSKPNEDEKIAGWKCFAPSIQNPTNDSIVIPQPKIILSEGVNRCIKDILGEEKYLKLTEGTLSPNNAIIEKAKVCVQKNNQEIQNKLIQDIVPPAPQISLLSPVKSGTVQITSVKKEITQRNNQKVPGTRLEGSGPANSVIYVYVYSEPIVVSVKTDTNGKWSYVLQKALDDGQHNVYVAAKEPNEELVRSEVIPFTLVRTAQAADNSEDIEIVTNQSNDTYSTFIMYGLILIGVGVLSVIILFKYSFNKKSNIS